MLLTALLLVFPAAGQGVQGVQGDSGADRQRMAATRAGGLAPSLPPPEDGSRMRVFLMTVAPGPAVWERFAHNTIVYYLYDTDDRPLTVSFNWGVFSFDDGFYWNFARKDLEYYLVAADFEAELDGYIRGQGRDVVLQELALSPGQKRSLFTDIRTTLDTNPAYAYDYYLDNCSTRVRDHLDRALDGALAEAWQGTGGEPGQTPRPTLRFHTSRSMADTPLWAPVVMALGPVGDEPLDRWAEAFLPMRLRAFMNDVRVPDASGERVPLVSRELVLHAAGNYAVPGEPPVRWPGFLLAGVVLGGGVAAGARSGRRWLVRVAAGLVAAVGLLAGLVGVVLAFMIFFTGHWPVRWNPNALHFVPFWLILAWAGAGWIGFGRLRRTARISAGLVAGCSLAGLLAALVFGFGDMNGLVLMLPTTLGVLAAVWTKRTDNPTAKELT
ncbi:MAG: DUF4105 domain-containing protein [Phycisphaerae bacterium]